MKIHIALALLLQISAVFEGGSSASVSSWTIVAGENGTVEIIDESSTLEQSESTLTELKKDVLFYLYTSSNPEDAEQIYLGDDDTLSASYFNFSNPTRMVTHGWLSSAEEVVATGPRDAYLSMGDFNYIAVDWSAYSSKNYMYAAAKVNTVGEYIGLMIDYLVYKGMDIADLIIIGHSLGAHITGIAGRSSISTVPVAVGLDPAGPLFYGSDYRITTTDADFLQIVHTSAGTLGYNGNIGDADIWPNGGRRQPGCGLDLVMTCAHSRSHKYFTESITDVTVSFLAHICDSNSDYTAGKCSFNNSTYLGGLDIDTTGNGSYLVATNSASIFALG